MALRKAILVCSAVVGLWTAGPSLAATYYVSPGGNDAAAGTSQATAWRTLAKVNGAKLQPGDSVLLEGGQTFAGPLVVWASGASGSPITFGSYGAGRATIAGQTNNIVFLHAASWVTIQNLRLTAEGADMHVVVSDPRTTSAYVTIRNNLITDTDAFGINSPSLTDHHWTIQGNTIDQTGETGITFRGSNFSVVGNVVENTGLHPSEAAHGIYAKGPAAQVIGNVVDRFSSSGVSIRYPNSVVRGNVISGGMIGVSYFQDAGVSSGGTSTIAYNRISDVSVAGIFLDDSSYERFVIANNTIRMTEGNGLNLHRVPALTLVNNLVTGTFDGYTVLLKRPAGTYVERNNLWFPGKVLSDAHGAAGNLGADPLLDAALRPRKGSPVVDAGLALRGLGYRRICDGKAFHYCGKAPDIGALEARR
jgi:Right handed beta helix region